MRYSKYAHDFGASVCGVLAVHLKEADAAAEKIQNIEIRV